MSSTTEGGTGVVRWAVRMALVWGGVGMLAWAALQAVPSGPEPARAGRAIAPPPTPAVATAGGRQLTIPAGRGGHFYVDAQVDGTAVRFLVDTGATRVVLDPADARRIGIHVRAPDFTGRAGTANGVVRIAPVTLRRVRIGPLALRHVEAAVNEAPMGISLLGMSFLERLDGYAVERDRLVLRW